MAGREEEGDRLARRAGAGEGALPDAAVEPAPVKAAARPWIAAVFLALWLGVVSIVQAQPRIRIGASLSQTGAVAGLAQNQRRGYQLCVKHMNDKGEVRTRQQSV